MLLKMKYVLLIRISFTYLILTLLGCKQLEYPKTMPEFSMRLPDTTKTFYSKDIPYGKTSVLIWFDPACRDCQEETEYILASMEKFREANFYLVTRHSYDDMMVFYEHLRLDTCKNLLVGIDTSRTIPRYFNARSTPLTVILNKDKMVSAIFSGKPDMEKFTVIINAKS
jgi:hypothetical protein